MKTAIEWIEKGLLPDCISRLGIRRLLARRPHDEDRGNPEARTRILADLLAELRDSPIALHTAQANAQHYELLPAFFQCIMGEHRSRIVAVSNLPLPGKTATARASFTRLPVIG